MSLSAEDTKLKDALTQSPDRVVTTLAEQDKTLWYRKPNLIKLYLVLLPTCIGVETTSGFDSSMMNGLQAVGTWETFFDHPRSALLGLMSAVYSLGAICALPLVAYVNDYLGRRKAIIFGSILMLLGAALQGAAVNMAMFIMARFVLGLGIPFAIVAATALIGELAHPKERPFLGSLFNSCYFIGSLVAAGITFGTFNMASNWAWRIPSLLQVTPSCLQLVFVWFLPESPRWLISKGRQNEALEILIKYHAEGDRDSEFVKAEYAQIETTIQIEMENSKRGWQELIATPGMRKRVVIGSMLGLFTQWSGNGLTSYFLSQILSNVGITSNRTKNLVNIGSTAFSLLNGTFFALTVSRFKRRTIYLTCSISLLLCFTAWTVASARYAETNSQASAIAVIFFIFAYGPCYNIGFNALTYTFLVELFPYHVRAKGITVFQWWGRMAGFFNQFVNPIGIDNAGWKFYISYCIFLLYEVVFIYFVFPETTNRTLEELAFLFEGEPMRLEQQKRIGGEIKYVDQGSDKEAEEKHSESPY